MTAQHMSRPRRVPKYDPSHVFREVSVHYVNPYGILKGKDELIKQELYLNR